MASSPPGPPYSKPWNLISHSLTTMTRKELYSSYNNEALLQTTSPALSRLQTVSSGYPHLPSLATSFSVSTWSYTTRSRFSSLCLYPTPFPLPDYRRINWLTGAALPVPPLTHHHQHLPLRHSQRSLSKDSLPMKSR